jgi:hypothetical protein
MDVAFTLGNRKSDQGRLVENHDFETASNVRDIERVRGGNYHGCEKARRVAQWTLSHARRFDQHLHHRLSAVVRYLFGNPFRTLPAIDPIILVGNDALIVKLADAAYDHRQLPSGELDPTRLGILADALEEAGADIVLIEHLRGWEPHVRGCFATDLLTGRS